MADIKVLHCKDLAVAEELEAPGPAGMVNLIGTAAISQIVARRRGPSRSDDRRMAWRTTPSSSTVVGSSKRRSPSGSGASRADSSYLDDAPTRVSGDRWDYARKDTKV